MAERSIGSRIRALRLRQQRTLKDVSQRCHFTVSLLSKIESGKTNPPVATLARIADALGVHLGDLLDTRKDPATIFDAAGERDTKTLTHTDKGYGFHLLAGERPDKLMQPFLFVAERGKVKKAAMAHRGEEFIYILEGRMHYRVGATTYTLGPGDTLYFSSEEEHDLEPISPRVKYLAIFAERGHPEPGKSRRKKP